MSWTPIDERWLIISDTRIAHRVLFPNSIKTACGRMVEREPVEDKLMEYSRCGLCATYSSAP